MKRQESAPKLVHAEVKAFYDSKYYGRASVVSRLPWHMRLVARRLGNLRKR